MNPTRQQFEDLYRETGPGLLAYFRSRPSLTVLAEDLLQDMFARALRNPERLAAALSPRAYLFGIARHVGHDAMRRLHPTEEFQDTEVWPVEREDERLERMRDAIGELPAAQRETLLLKLRHDLSYVEIASVLDVPVGTVRSRLHNAVLALRATINPTT